MMYRNPNPIWAYRKKALRGFFLGLVTHKSLGIRDTPTSRERGSKEKGRPLSLSSPNNDKHETSICSNVTNVVVCLGRKKNSPLTTYFYVNLTRLCLPLESRFPISHITRNEFHFKQQRCMYVHLTAWKTDKKFVTTVGNNCVCVPSLQIRQMRNAIG